MTASSLMSVAIICAVFFITVCKSSTESTCSQWAAWSSCTVQCGGGQKSRVRSCVKQGSLMSQMDKGTCNNKSCDRECTDWSEWSQCSAPCGPDVKKMRVRQCVTQVSCCRCEPQRITETDYTQCPDISCICTGKQCKWNAADTAGYTPHPKFCNAYYVCSRNGRGGFKVDLMWCGENTVWNSEILTCAWRRATGMPPCNITTPPTTIAPTTQPFRCPFQEVRGFPKKFRSGGKLQSCGPSMLFDFDACTCVRDPDSTLPPVTCDDCLYFPFDNHFNDVNCNGAISRNVGGVKGVKGKKGDAAYFNGNSRLQVSMFRNWLHGANDGSELTISVWVKRDCYHTHIKQGLVVNAECETAPTVDLHLINGAAQGGVRNYSNAGLDAFSTNHSVTCGVWYHLAMVLRAGQLKLYVNGIPVEQQTVIGPMKTSTVVLYIGHTGQEDNEFYKGIMDELYVCRRGFSDDEVREKAMISRHNLENIK